MATCPLTSAYSYADNCEAYSGGVKAVYFCEAFNKNTFAVTAGVVTTFTLQGSAVFRRYVPKKNTAFWSDSFAKNESGSVTYTPTVVLPLGSLITTLRQEIQLLAKNYLMIIVLDNNGVYRLFGYDHIMELTTGDVQGGTLLSDGQKQTLTFAGSEDKPAYEISSGSILTAIGVVAP